MLECILFKFHKVINIVCLVEIKIFFYRNCSYLIFLTLKIFYEFFMGLPYQRTALVFVILKIVTAFYPCSTEFLELTHGLLI